MNLNQLYYFRELAEQRQYTRASENLFISQPTLSISIKQLEKELNCKLFKYSGRHLELTKYGRLFYDHVVTTLNALDSGKRQLQQVISQDQGKINIACVPTAIGILIPQLVKEYKLEVEKVPHFIYHDNPSYQICKGIENGWYDIGICSYVDNFDNFTYVPFYNEEIIAITSLENNLAKIKSISSEELRGENLLTYTKKIQIGRDITNALLSRESDLNITNRLHDELAIAGQVVTNNVIGIVANTIYLNGFNIHKIKLDLPEDTRKIYIVYDPQKFFSPELINFIDFLKSKKSDIKKDSSIINGSQKLTNKQS